MVADRSMSNPENGVPPVETWDAPSPEAATATARLVVMPAPASQAAPRNSVRRGLLEDVADLGLRRIAAFLAEAAVLVLVLGLLERLLAVHHVEWRWAVAVVSLSALLLAAGIGLEVLQRRRAERSPLSS